MHVLAASLSGTDSPILASCVEKGELPLTESAFIYGKTCLNSTVVPAEQSNFYVNSCQQPLVEEHVVIKFCSFSSVDVLHIRQLNIGVLNSTEVLLTIDVLI